MPFEPPTQSPTAWLNPDAVVIATALGERGSGESGKDVPVLIASNLGQGRIICLQRLGHDPAAMHEKGFMAIFARACESAATGAVTLPPDLGPTRSSGDAVKALLITGGHDHEAAFYTIFDGYNDLGWIPVVTSRHRFQGRHSRQVQRGHHVRLLPRP